MPIATRDIRFGAGRLYLGCSLPQPEPPGPFPVTFVRLSPTSPPPPTLIPEPIGGTDIGATVSATFIIRQRIEPVRVEQRAAPVFGQVTETDATLEIEVAETTVDKLLSYFSGAEARTVTTPFQTTRLLTAGAGPQTARIITGICLAQIVRQAPTRVFYVLLYQGYPEEGIELSFAREEMTTGIVKFRAVADTTRPTNDDLFQMAETDSELILP